MYPFARRKIEFNALNGGSHIDHSKSEKSDIAFFRPEISHFPAILGHPAFLNFAQVGRVSEKIEEKTKIP